MQSRCGALALLAKSSGLLHVYGLLLAAVCRWSEPPGKASSPWRAASRAPGARGGLPLKRVKLRKPSAVVCGVLKATRYGFARPASAGGAASSAAPAGCAPPAGCADAHASRGYAGGRTR